MLVSRQVSTSIFGTPGGIVINAKTVFFFSKILNFLNVKKNSLLTEILEYKKNTVFFQKKILFQKQRFLLIKAF
jgi:hypothetical protein